MTSAAHAVTLTGAHGSFVATFRPAARWSDKIRRHDGIRCAWKPLWQISDGPFAGEMACVPLNGAAPGLAWAPESELVDLTPRKL